MEGTRLPTEGKKLDLTGAGLRPVFFTGTGPDNVRNIFLGQPLRLACLFAVVVVASAGCGGGTDVPPAATIARIAGDEQLGSINAPLSVPLSVRVTGAGGTPLEGKAVTWAVTEGGGTVAPTTSVTDADGVASTTWTLGPVPGQQRATATVEGGVSTTFTAIATSAVACDPNIEMNVGGVCLASPARAADVQVRGGTSGAEYVAIPYYDGNLTRNPITVSATAIGATAASGPPNPAIVPASALAIDGNAALLPASDLGFERRLRTRERELVRSLVSTGGGGGAGAVLSVTPGDPRLVVEGEQLQLNANPLSNCSNPDYTQGIVRKISTRGIFVEDTDNPPGGFSAADWNDLAVAFDNDIWPTVTSAFGIHTDIDNNQRAIIFFTIRVNQLTPKNQASSYVGGFFFSRDLFPKTGNVLTPANKNLGECVGSNAAEMFYMLAPDPTGIFSAPRSTAFVKEVSPGTIAHELQHLINSSRRLYVTAGSANQEVVWMEEGLSHIAEELVYYKVTGFSPRQNLSRANIVATQALETALENYQRANLGRLSSYLRSTNSQSPYGESSSCPSPPTPCNWDDLETRGAIWSFLRWAADHRGTSDGDVWMQLANNPVIGIANLRDVFGTDIGSRFREWAAANYMDDAAGVPQADVTFRHPSWDLRTAILTVGSNNNQFPLATFNIAGQMPVFTLVDGGAAYLRFGVSANVSANVRVTMSGGPLPAGASVWFVRTK